MPLYYRKHISDKNKNAIRLAQRICSTILSFTQIVKHISLFFCVWNATIYLISCRICYGDVRVFGIHDLGLCFGAWCTHLLNTTVYELMHKRMDCFVWSSAWRILYFLFYLSHELDVLKFYHHWPSESGILGVGVIWTVVIVMVVTMGCKCR